LGIPFPKSGIKKGVVHAPPVAPPARALGRRGAGCLSHNGR
jgi:hypothetical protein